MARTLVIFDLDGTLVDSQDHIVAALRQAYADAGFVAPERDRLLSIVGLSLPEVFAELSPNLPVAEQEVLAANYRAVFVRNREDADPGAEAPLYNGARDIVVDLATRPGFTLGIATGKARRGVDHFFKVHGLGAHFQTIQTADDHPSKPHPSMVRTAIAQAGGVPGGAVMVGDTEFDIAMGKAAGAHSIGVSWGYHPVERLHRAGADLIVDDFRDLHAAITEFARRERVA